MLFGCSFVLQGHATLVCHPWVLVAKHAMLLLRLHSYSRICNWELVLPTLMFHTQDANALRPHYTSMRHVFCAGVRP